jgi:hypothetical protein
MINEMNQPEYEVVMLRTAQIGKLQAYLDVEPDRLHAQQPGVLFRVNLPSEVTAGEPVVQPAYGLFGCETGRPVALVMFCVGKLLVAASFNPLEPDMRRHLKTISSDFFTCALEFDVESASEPTSRMNFALVTLPMDAFSAALAATEGMPSVTTTEWLPSVEHLMREGLTEMGMLDALQNDVYLRLFRVVAPGQMMEVNKYWQEVEQFA